MSQSWLYVIARRWPKFIAACVGALALVLGVVPAPAQAADADLPVTFPVSGMYTSSPVDLDFTVLNTPVAGSLQFTFDGTGTDFVMVPSVQGTGIYHYEVNTLNPISSGMSSVVPSGTPVPDGVYTITVSYDSGGTHYTRSVSNVTIDTSTLAPVMTSPLSGSTSSMFMNFTLSTPEASYPGSAKIVLAWGATQRVIDLVAFGAGVTKNFTLNLSDSNADLQSNNPSVVASASGSIPSIGDVVSVSFSYQDTIGNSAASVTNSSVTLATPCGMGYFGAGGYAPCTEASPGHYVAVPLATAETPCPGGYYQPLGGSTFCLIAPAGTYASGGAAFTTGCAPGTYQPDEGQSSCLDAPINTYVNFGASASTTPCPEGTSTTGTGSTSADDCKAPVVETPQDAVPVAAPVAKDPCTFHVGSKLGLKCVLELSKLNSLKNSDVKFSVSKKSSKICAVRKGKLVGKRPGTCRILVVPEVVNSLGKKHKVALSVT